jgi:CubicO group peptidase (beta-lactamase class C family)
MSSDGQKNKLVPFSLCNDSILCVLLAAALGSSPVTVAFARAGQDLTRSRPVGVEAGAVDRPARGRLDSYMTQAEATGFSGGLVVVNHGGIVISKGYGFSDKAQKRAFDQNTVFQIGSITKMFTAAAILKLEMQGKLNVSDSLPKFFKNVPADKAGITIHQLLTHTSGIPENVGPDFEELSRDGFIKRVFSTPLAYKSGAEPHYSNAAFSVAAAIIEIASGKRYEQYLHDEILLPAHMLYTGYVIPQWNQDSLAHEYKDGEDAGVLLSKWGAGGPYWNLLGNGGLLATLGDMYRWYVALQGNTILSDQAKRKFFTPYVKEDEHEEDGLAFGYGCGIMKSRRGTKVIFKNGGDLVDYSEIDIYPEDDMMLFFTSTNSAVRPGKLGDGIRNIMFEPSGKSGNPGATS